MLRFEADGYLSVESPPVRTTPMGIDDTSFGIKLPKALALSGSIKLPSGAPAADADIFFASANFPLLLEINKLKAPDPIRRDWNGARSVKSDENSNFLIISEIATFELCVLHTEGMAIVKDSDLLGGKPIQLDKWATVTGIARHDTEPVKGQTIALNSEIS